MTLKRVNLRPFWRPYMTPKSAIIARSDEIWGSEADFGSGPQISSESGNLGSESGNLGSEPGIWPDWNPLSQKYARVWRKT
jgi:hypothetical protein